MAWVWPVSGLSARPRTNNLLRPGPRLVTVRPARRVASAEVSRSEAHRCTVGIATRLELADLVERLPEEEEGVGVLRVLAEDLPERLHRLPVPLLVEKLGRLFDGGPLCGVAIHDCTC